MVHAVLDEWYRTERELCEFLAPTCPSAYDALAPTGGRRRGAAPVDAFTRLLARHVAAPATPSTGC